MKDKKSTRLNSNVSSQSNRPKFLSCYDCIKPEFKAGKHCGNIKLLTYFSLETFLKCTSDVTSSVTYFTVRRQWQTTVPRQMYSKFMFLFFIRYVRNRIDHWCTVEPGNPNPRVHRSSGKLGEASFPTGTVDPRVGISLSPLNTNDGFSLSIYQPR